MMGDYLIYKILHLGLCFLDDYWYALSHNFKREYSMFIEYKN